MKPVAPSKIPVGWFRVEEEKRINRALSRDRSSLAASSSGKMVRERSMSRIPVFSSRSSCTVRIEEHEYKVYNCAPSSGYRGAHPRWAGPHPAEAGVRVHIGSVLSRGRGYTRGRDRNGQQVTLALLLHLNLLQPEVSHISFPWITQLLDRQPSKLQQPSSSRLQKWRSDPNITREQHNAKLKKVAERF